MAACRLLRQGRRGLGGCVGPEGTCPLPAPPPRETAAHARAMAKLPDQLAQLCTMNL